MITGGLGRFGIFDLFESKETPGSFLFRACGRDEDLQMNVFEFFHDPSLRGSGHCVLRRYDDLVEQFCLQVERMKDLCQPGV